MPSDPLLSFAVASFACTATPGPNAMLIIRNTAAYGAGSTLPTLAGQMMARLALGISVMLGLSALLVSMPALAAVMKVAGASYLVFLGLKLMMPRSLKRRSSLAPDVIRNASSTNAVVVEAALVSGLNPNTLGFLAAALPQALDTNRPMLGQLPALLLIDASVLLSVMLFYAFATRLAADRVAQGNGARVLRRIGGATLIALGIGMLAKI